MAKTLTIIYPGLRAEMSYHNEDTEDLSKLLNISADTTRRRLRGKKEFDLSECQTLMDHYDRTFEELFGKAEKVAQQ